MQNKFGLKDFVLLVLVSLIGVLTVLDQIQDDQKTEQVRTMQSDIEDARQNIQQIRREIEDDVTSNREMLQATLREEIAGIRQQIDRLGEAASGTGGLTVGEASEDNSGMFPWARPGVAVTVPDEFSYPSDPTEMEGYREGGEFIELFEAQLRKITPYFYNDVYGRRIIDGPVCESLAAYDPETLRLVGLLAEAWQMDPEGMWLRAKIRERARFSDGEPVTADDFVFTYDLVFNPQLDTARFRSTLDVIDEVRAIDEKVVEFTFDKPQFTNESAALRMLVIPEHIYSEFQPAQLNEAPGLLMGSGPYRLERFDPDNQWKQGEPVVLVRNENYWGERPPFDVRRYIVRQDSITRMTAFTNREGDMMRPTAEQYAENTRNPAFVEQNHALDWTNMRSGYAFIAWNTGERNGELTPFHDKRVRQAMTMLIDREAFVRDILNGLGDVATGPFPPVSDQNDPDITPWPYDPERAKELLADAGWVDRDGNGILEDEEGREFSFEYLRSTLTSPTARRGWQFLKEAFESAGIRVTLRVADWSVLSSVVDSRDFDAVSFAWSASAPESDPNQLWHSDQIDDAGDNFSQWDNPEADRLIEEGRATLDYDARMEIWRALHRLLHEEQPYTFLYNPRWLRFINGEVENVHPYAEGLVIEEMFMPEPGI